MENNKMILTLEEKIDEIRERIIQAAFDEFETSLDEDQLEELLENDKYYDKAYAQPIWVDGFEQTPFSAVMEMPYEDILYIHNDIYGTNKTLSELDAMEVFYNRSLRAVTEMTDKEGHSTIVPLWMAL